MRNKQRETGGYKKVFKYRWAYIQPTRVAAKKLLDDASGIFGGY